MKNRFNGNYEIIESVSLNSKEELAIGFNPDHPNTNSRFVCWYYNKINDYYFWGYYTDTKENAIKKLNQRKGF